MRSTVLGFAALHAVVHFLDLKSEASFANEGMERCACEEEFTGTGLETADDAVPAKAGFRYWRHQI